jgi:hypothetical protein
MAVFVIIIILLILGFGFYKYLYDGVEPQASSKKRISREVYLGIIDGLKQQHESGKK